MLRGPLKGLPISLCFEPEASEEQPVPNLLLCLPLSQGLFVHFHMVEESEEEELLMTLFLVLGMSSGL